MVEEQTDIIAKATIAAERLKEQNDRMEANIKKQEAWEARQILGGRSSAGTPEAREVTPEEKNMEDMKKFFKGSAVEGYLK